MPPQADGKGAGTGPLRERLSQLVGMSAAARLLGGELAGMLAAGAREVAQASALRECLGCDDETARRLSALLAAWLLERARLVFARCAEEAERWLAEAHRLEGRLEAMEEAAWTRAPGLPSQAG